jgi:serine/threonine protein kinase
MHSVGFSHLDIKPHNVCIELEAEGTYRTKLIDFGSSCSIPEQGSWNMDMPGTWLYSPPEGQVEDQPFIGPEADVW